MVATVINVNFRPKNAEGDHMGNMKVETGLKTGKGEGQAIDLATANTGSGYSPELELKRFSGGQGAATVAHNLASLAHRAADTRVGNDAMKRFTGIDWEMKH